MPMRVWTSKRQYQAETRYVAAGKKPGETQSAIWTAVVTRDAARMVDDSEDPHTCFCCSQHHPNDQKTVVFLDCSCACGNLEAFSRE